MYLKTSSKKRLICSFVFSNLTRLEISILAHPATLLCGVSSKIRKSKKKYNTGIFFIICEHMQSRIDDAVSAAKNLEIEANRIFSKKKRKGK